MAKIYFIFDGWKNEDARKKYYNDINFYGGEMQSHRALPFAPPGLYNISTKNLREDGTSIGETIYVRYLPRMLTKADILKFISQLEFFSHPIEKKIALHKSQQILIQKDNQKINYRKIKKIYFALDGWKNKNSKQLYHSDIDFYGQEMQTHRALPFAPQGILQMYSINVSKKQYLQEGGTPIGATIELIYFSDILTEVDILEFMNQVEFFSHAIVKNQKKFATLCSGKAAAPAATDPATPPRSSSTTGE